MMCQIFRQFKKHMKKSIYKLEDVSFSYVLGTNLIHALKNISLEIKEGDFICFAGPSGSGKSTLLNLLGLIEISKDSNIFLEDQKICDLTPTQLSNTRLFKLGFVFQNFNLFNILNVYENVEYFLTLQNIESNRKEKIIEESLKQVDLWHFKNHRPTELSGGQRQRVAIARALAKNPKIIIADELTASLDQKIGKEIINLLLELNEKNNITVILSSHDPMVLSMSKRLCYLKDGLLQ